MLRTTLALALAASAAAETINIGPGQTYATLSAASTKLLQLQAGDLVRVHYAIYNEKLVAHGNGGPGNEIVFEGVPDPTTGAKPVLDGDGAVTLANFNYFDEDVR